jgi:hypothetical protein
MIKSLALCIYLVLSLGVAANAQTQDLCTPFCPPQGWSKINATEGFKESIMSQEALIEDFEHLLHKYGATFSGEENSTFLASFEELLRRQTLLHQSFASLLGDQSHWNYTEPEEQVGLLQAYGEMLAKEKLLYASFFDLLNATWCRTDFIESKGSCPEANTHMEFLYSYEDLISRQEKLLIHYYWLANELNPDVSEQDIVNSIRFFEDLLRLHSAALANLEALIKKDCMSSQPTHSSNKYQNDKYSRCP